MTTHISNAARQRFLIAGAAAALVTSLSVATVAAAQSTTIDPRWQPFLGCWVQEASSAAVGLNAVSGSMVCVVPVQNSTSVDITSINNRVVVNRDRLTVTGERVAKNADNCPGFETASWSADGHRIYTRSDYKCGATEVKGSTVLGLSSAGDWVQVQGTSVGSNSGARVVRFRPADVALAPGSIITDSAIVNTVPVQSGFAEQAMRSAAGAPTDAKALLDISKHVDEQVAQAWLSEFGTSTKVNAQELLALSDAGMPADLTDMLVAIANPDRFQLKTRSPVSENGTQVLTAAQSNDLRRCGADYMDDPRFGLMQSEYDRRYCMSRYGSAFGYPFGYLSGWGNAYDRYYGYNGYNGSNYYYGSRPIIIVTRGSDGGIGTDGSSVTRGRAVKGGGYSNGKSSNSGSGTPRQTVTSGSKSSGSSEASSSSGSSTSSGSSGSTTTTRTAKPKPPGSN